MKARAEAFVDDDGTVRGSQIEYLYDDFYSGVLHEHTEDNFKILCGTLLGDNLKPPANVCTDYDAAMKWATAIGAVTTFELTEEQFEQEPDNKKYNARLGCKIGPLDLGSYVSASTPHFALLLAVVQVMRELFSAMNEIQEDDTRTVH